MIQRIQTIWLLLAGLLAVAAFFLPFYSGVPVDMATTNSPREELTGQSTWLLRILTGLVAFTSFILILLYKNRRQQLLFTLANALAAIGLIFAFYGETSRFMRGQGSLDLTSIVVFAIPVFLLLAARAIQQDEKLVRSLNRLR